jgi:endoglucanase
MKKQDLDLLYELTAIPTAAGREHRVIAWVTRWVGRRKNLKLRCDEHGNLLITQAGADASVDHGPKPIFLTAHLDHPAFVVSRVVDPRTLELEFRGGVRAECFPGKEVEIFDAADGKWYGKITDLETATPFQKVTVRLVRRCVSLAPGDVGRWRLRGRGSRPTVVAGLFYAPACDDLAGAAAALAVLDNLRRRPRFSHVGLLLTRAEEVGFVGAIGAARSGTVPRDARLICLETSRSFAESPIGGGPILRVGDRMTVFSPGLTNLLGQILREHERVHPGFRWQRKLMPGGACEATAFAEYGYHATCICLPLGNYHNMTDCSLPEGAKPTGGIGPEFISVADYAGLVEMLRICIEKMDVDQSPLRGSLEARFQNLQTVLRG